MMRILRNFGDWIDRWDVGGWLLLLCGMSVVTLTLLAPAWTDVRTLDAQTIVLRQQVHALQLQHTNYVSFIRALEDGDPLLLQRLAYHHLRLKPADTRLITALPAGAAPPALSVDRWLRPASLGQVPDEATYTPYPDSRLVRLVTGPPRPWVLAFGGWLVLMGLLLNPRPSSSP